MCADAAAQREQLAAAHADQVAALRALAEQEKDRAVRAETALDAERAERIRTAGRLETAQDELTRLRTGDQAPAVEQSGAPKRRRKE